MSACAYCHYRAVAAPDSHRAKPAASKRECRCRDHRCARARGHPGACVVRRYPIPTPPSDATARRLETTAPVAAHRAARRRDACARAIRRSLIRNAHRSHHCAPLPRAAHSPPESLARGWRVPADRPATPSDRPRATRSGHAIPPPSVASRRWPRESPRRDTHGPTPPPATHAPMHRSPAVESRRRPRPARRRRPSRVATPHALPANATEIAAPARRPPRRGVCERRVPAWSA